MKVQQHRIALVAHDNLKPALINWSKDNRQILSEHELFATGTTGRLIAEQTDLRITCLRSGPLGGDQQIGSRITEGLIDILIFFWDPLSAMPHDADIKALLRLATLMNIPVANNQSTADCVLAMLQLGKTDPQPWVVNFRTDGPTQRLWPDNYVSRPQTSLPQPHAYASTLKQAVIPYGKMEIGSKVKHPSAPPLTAKFPGQQKVY